MDDDNRVESLEMVDRLSKVVTIAITSLLMDVGRILLENPLAVRAKATTFEVLSMNGQGGIKEQTKSRPNEEEFVVIEYKGVACGDGNDEVLVRAYPRSGRTHQIHLHCQYLGIPIRGDVKYEGVYEWKGETFDVIALPYNTILISSFLFPLKT
ncbi:Rna pseudouridine synthase [Thalictrum thalictroides]|uniref:Rna pseudouridine synthase n=1 Tax=Thalictrum thalictroides TaxID=46969 RepID=A0A7J6X7Y8_THATH|nr:Rna pseudouridine synthase [Thalictrum thalictroides]